VNDVCSQSERRRFLSLQYTILVLSGWSSSPTSAILFSRAASTFLACHSVAQCTTASSA
jgi:hypothetical protein